MICQGYISRLGFRINYCLWLIILECAKMTISVRALGYSLSLSMEIIPTILLFQRISHSRNDFKLRREVILDKAMELVQKQLSANCLDFQSMVDIVFVQVVPVLLLLWHT